MTRVTKRNGHQLALRWSWWHVMQMLHAAELPSREVSAEFPTGCPAVFDWSFPTGDYTMPHDFSVCDVSDREHLTFKKGWTLSMWRS
jgi:hypothetical protein